MSLAEDLLNSLPEDQATTYSLDPATEPHIIINADKTVTVPEELKRILVQYDHNIETVTFDCPRYWYGHDLSQMGLRIVFQRSDGHREPHPVENLRIDPDNDEMIHFDWTISENTTLTSGNVKITVCAKLTNAEGVSEREWHTIPNQDLFVNEGMECSGEEIVERNPDVIEYILAELDELKSTGGNGSNSDSGQNANGGLSTTAANLLVEILRNGVYSADQSANITALAEVLAATEPDSPDVPDVPDVPDDPDAVVYTVTNNLTNVTNSNAAVSVTEGAGYAATLTAAEGYTLDGGTVTVTMGGVDITGTVYLDGDISIVTVSGDIVITATATAKPLDVPLITMDASSGNIVYSDGGDTVLWENKYVGFNRVSEETFERDTDITITVMTTGTGFQKLYLACCNNNGTDKNFYHATMFSNGYSDIPKEGTYTFEAVAKAGYQFAILCDDNWLSNLSEITVTKEV